MDIILIMDNVEGLMIKKTIEDMIMMIGENKMMINIIEMTDLLLNGTVAIIALIILIKIHEAIVMNVMIIMNVMNIMIVMTKTIALSPREETASLVTLALAQSLPNLTNMKQQSTNLSKLY